MKDCTYLGSTPCDEPCAQVGEENYVADARNECNRYIRQLRRMFGEEPEGARLKAKASSHDFGTYYEVVCEFDGNNETAVEYAYRCENESPAKWDKEE